MFWRSVQKALWLVLVVVFALVTGSFLAEAQATDTPEPLQQPAELSVGQFARLIESGQLRSNPNGPVIATVEQWQELELLSLPRAGRDGVEWVQVSSFVGDTGWIPLENLFLALPESTASVRYYPDGWVYATPLSAYRHRDAGIFDSHQHSLCFDFAVPVDDLHHSTLLFNGRARNLDFRLDVGGNCLELPRNWVFAHSGLRPIWSNTWAWLLIFERPELFELTPTLLIATPPPGK